MKNEKDLIEEIGNVLHAHEDAYVPGAWEDFVKTKKRRRGAVYLRYVAAAAVLLIAGYAAWFFVPATNVTTNNNQTKNNTKPYIYPNNKTGHHSRMADRAAVPPTNTDNANAALPEAQPEVKRTAAVSPILGYNPINDIPVEPVKPNGNADQSAIAAITANTPLKDPETIAKNDQPVITNTPAGVTTDALPIVKTEPRRYDRGTQRLSYDSLANLNKPQPAIASTEKSGKNLSYGVMVSPSVGNQKMNFGTGIEVAYNINKNISVSSGVSYAYVNAGSHRNPAFPEATQNTSLQGFNASLTSKTESFSGLDAARSSQSVQDVKLALSGLEIPLNFQYKTTDGFFLSAGVSAMSVIGNDLSYNYINNRTVSTPSPNGFASTLSVVTEEITEKSNENLSGYIGFYTLSAGKKINFGRGKLNFAPFIKVPFNRVSSENIQLIHGGVKLGFGF